MDLYLVIIIPPKEIQDRVDMYRGKYRLYSSSIIPPHITIYPPFIIKTSEEEIIKLLESVAGDIKDTEIKTSRINYFEGNNNVAYFDPDNESAKILKNIFGKVYGILSEHVDNAFSGYSTSEENYKPHMTIADKIPDAEVERIKGELRDVRESFIFKINKLYLYKKYADSNEWKDVGSVNLKK